MSLDHFAYYPFLSMFIIVACDKDNKPIGYISILSNNEVGKLYVYPEHRGSDLYHTLLVEALNVAKGFGMTFLWATCFERVHRLYSRTYAKDAQLHGYSFKFVEGPEERDDGKWIIVSELLPEEK